jgi:ubiquinone/menaquinone biosynthesis C-methylase UbiE
MLSRVLEPEVMDTAEEALDYDTMDHSFVNGLFADQFVELLRGSSLRPQGRWQVLDVGTGTAQIPMEIVRRRSDVNIVAIDLSREMLKLGQINLERAGVTASIRLELVDAKQLPDADTSYDAVISNSIIHHIPEPLQSLREMVRVLRPGGILFVRDLMRPPDLPTLENLVEQHAAGANPHQRKLFAESLRAALTVEEVAGLLRQVGLPAEWVTATSDRHWTICSR